MLDQLIEFALDVGATTLAETVRHEQARIDAARLYVDVIGPRPAEEIEGVIVAAGTAEDLAGAGRRVDALVAERAQGRELAKLPPWRGSHLVTVSSSEAELADAFAELETLALDLGAGFCGVAELDCIRLTRALLHEHLAEHQRALRCERLARRRCHRLSIARVITENLLAERGDQPELERGRLLAWLQVERQKFLMASKADAIAGLADRLEGTRVPAKQLRAMAAVHAHEVARKLLLPFVDRVTAETRRAIAASAGQLISELTATLGDLAEDVPLSLLLPPETRASTVVLASRMRVPATSWKDSFSTRQQVESAACDQLVRTLEHESNLAIQRLVAEYDRQRMLVERWCCELIDIVGDSVRSAEQLARAHGAGAANMVAVWCSMFATLEQHERTIAS